MTETIIYKRLKNTFPNFRDEDIVLMEVIIQHEIIERMRIDRGLKNPDKDKTDYLFLVDKVKRY